VYDILADCGGDLRLKKNAAAKFQNAASPTAAPGDSTWVETMVAIEFAAS